jgi:hypothetical protein
VQAFNSNDGGYGDSSNSDSYYTAGSEPYSGWCGRYYSDENPGCWQQ